MFSQRMYARSSRGSMLGWHSRKKTRGGRVSMKTALFLLIFVTSVGAEDKAIFKMAEEYGGRPDSVHWRIRDVIEVGGIDDNFEEIANESSPSLEVDWTAVLGKKVSVEAFAKLEGESCITFSERVFDFRNHDNLSLRYMADAGYYRLMVSLEDRPPFRYQEVYRDYLPLGLRVNFQYSEYVGIRDHNPSYDSFGWTIEKPLDNEGIPIEIQTPTEDFSYVFNEEGLYKVSLLAVASNPGPTYRDGVVLRSEAETEVLIGGCENMQAVEVILDVASFPEEGDIQRTIFPFWNMVRPSGCGPCRQRVGEREDLPV